MSRYVKMILAALGAFATWGITAGADEGYTDVELYGLLGAVITAVTVYAFPNRPPAGEMSDPNVSEQDPQAGYSLVEIMVAAFFAVLIVLVLVRLL